MISVTKWHGENAAVLQNEKVSAAVLPEHGGKIASLYEKHKRFELLFQNPHPCFKRASLGDAFSEYEACGYDDAFPTIDECGVCLNGCRITYPDHGEIWSASLSYSVNGDSVEMCYNSKILPYKYEKKISLEDRGIKCEYKITNNGGFSFPYLWAFHCLVNMEDGMGLIYPKNTHELVNVQNSGVLGRTGACCQFTQNFCRPPSRPTTKYYVKGKVTEGRCGYEYPAHGLKAVIAYNPDSLPYLGFWCTHGGFRGDVNCAFEPATGFYDNALKAFQAGTGSILKPSETVAFSLKISFANM